MINALRADGIAKIVSDEHPLGALQVGVMLTWEDAQNQDRLQAAGEALAAKILRLRLVTFSPLFLPASVEGSRLVRDPLTGVYVRVIKDWAYVDPSAPLTPGQPIINHATGERATAMALMVRIDVLGTPAS